MRTARNVHGNRRSLVALAILIGVTAVLTAASGNSRPAPFSGVRSNPELHSISTGQGGCLEAVAGFSVNEYTNSVSLHYTVWDPATGNPKSGALGAEVRNVTPGTGGHSKSGFGFVDGDSIIFSMGAWSGPNGTGSYVGAFKPSQLVADCVE